jgi:hypothetical protein
MSDIKSQGPFKGVDRRAPNTVPTGGKPVTPAPSADYDLLKRSDRTGGRHSAITTNLYSWHSYKSWAEKIRGSWEEKK